MRHGQALAARPPIAPPHRRPPAIRAAARAVLRSSLARVLRTPAGLAAVNRLHAALTLPQKRRFFYATFDLPCRVHGPWAVDFAGRRLVLPLRRDFELAWMAATAFHGYDTEVHELYESLVRASRPPGVFFDVGASYGLHSLKLLAHGVRVVSFEPNVDCHPFLVACARANGVSPDVRAVAVGAATGRARLRVPAGRTWLGTTAPHVTPSCDPGVEIETRPVPQVALDDVVRTDRLVPDVVKIDIEGGELAVLAGARAVLEHARPLLILESWPTSADRVVLFELLASYGYGLHALRFAAPASPALTLPAFVTCPATNFAARSAPPAA